MGAHIIIIILIIATNSWSCKNILVGIFFIILLSLCNEEKSRWTLAVGIKKIKK